MKVPTYQSHSQNEVLVAQVLTNLTNSFTGTDDMRRLLLKHAADDRASNELALCIYATYQHMLKMAHLQLHHPKMRLYTAAQTLYDALGMVLNDIHAMDDSEPYIQMQQTLNMVITGELANAIQR